MLGCWWGWGEIKKSHTWILTFSLLNKLSLSIRSLSRSLSHTSARVQCSGTWEKWRSSRGDSRTQCEGEGAPRSLTHTYRYSYTHTREARIFRLYHSNLKIITLIWLFGSRGIKYGSKLVNVRRFLANVTFLTRFAGAKNVTWAK